MSVAVACRYFRVCSMLPLWLWRVAMFMVVACRYVYGGGVSLCLWWWRVAMSVAVACRYVYGGGVWLCLWL